MGENNWGTQLPSTKLNEKFSNIHNTPNLLIHPAGYNPLGPRDIHRDIFQVLIPFFFIYITVDICFVLSGLISIHSSRLSAVGINGIYILLGYKPLGLTGYTF